MKLLTVIYISYGTCMLIQSLQVHSMYAKGNYYAMGYLIITMFLITLVLYFTRVLHRCMNVMKEQGDVIKRQGDIITWQRDKIKSLNKGIV